MRPTFTNEPPAPRAERQDSMQLANGYTLRIIPPGYESPMQHHLGGEIAVDEDTKTMYAWGVFVRFYGLGSTIKACLSYPARPHGQKGRRP